MGLIYRSSVAQDELHDALEDTKQIPIITEAFERLAGPEYSLAELATPKPGVKYRATPVDAVVRKRHVQLQEKVVKRRASDPTVLATKSTANGHSSFDASEKTSTSKTKSNAAAQYALPCQDGVLIFAWPMFSLSCVLRAACA